MSFSIPPLHLNIDDESIRRQTESSNSSTHSINYVSTHQSYNTVTTSNQDSSCLSETISSNENISGKSPHPTINTGYHLYSRYPDFDPTAANGLRIIYDREVRCARILFQFYLKYRNLCRFPLKFVGSILTAAQAEGMKMGTAPSPPKTIAKIAVRYQTQIWEQCKRLK